MPPTNSHSTLAVCADLHIGNYKTRGDAVVEGLNERGHQCLTAYRACIHFALQHARVLYIAGDLFNSRKPEVALVTAVMKATEAGVEAGLEVVVIPGNHDMLDATAAAGNTACSPLYPFAKVVNTPEWFVHGRQPVLCIPFDSTVPMRDYLAGVITPWPYTEDQELKPTLITHVGIYDDTSHPWTTSASDGMHANELFALMEKNGIKNAFVGNFHHHFIWSQDDMTIVQCGTMIPHGHGDSGEYPRVGALWLYDVDTTQLSSVEIPGPRYITIDEGTRGVGVSDGEGHVEVTSQEPTTERQVRIALGSTHKLPSSADGPEAIAAYFDKQRTDGKIPSKILNTELLEAALRYWSYA